MSTFTRVMLCAAAIFFQIIGVAYAQKPDDTAVRNRKEVRCLALVMANEALHTREGWVSVGVSLLVRASAREDGSLCAAAYAPGQFTKLVKKPTPAMLRLAEQMYEDWKKGHPTVEASLQKALDGCAYFYNPKLASPKWGRTFIDCGHVAGHEFRRDPKSNVLAYN